MLKVVTLPDLQVSHSMKVSGSTQLFHGPSTEVAQVRSFHFLSIIPTSYFQDAIYYLDTSSTSRFVSIYACSHMRVMWFPISVEVLCLVQALPEKQLATMLTQHRFTEALSFAMEYDIDSQVTVTDVIRP